MSDADRLKQIVELQDMLAESRVAVKANMDDLQKAWAEKREAEAEVARLTAVVRGVKELADTMAAQDPATNLAGVETWSDRLCAVLAGGTDTPKDDLPDWPVTEVGQGCDWPVRPAVLTEECGEKLMSPGLESLNILCVSDLGHDGNHCWVVSPEDGGGDD